MDEQRVMILLHLVAFFATVQECFSFSNDQQMGSSLILPVSGNVYPKGYYHATLNIGSPPRPYSLDIDTGSEVTWLQCDAPCVKCFPAPHPLYKPCEDIVKCHDPFCPLFHWPNNVPCQSSEEQCDYEVNYADHSSSLGVLIRDLFLFKLTNGNTVLPRLAFGCGYDQEVADGVHPPYTDGVLGLSNGKSTILAQLRKLGLIQNVFGHCFSAQGGGYLFMGENILPSSGIVWAPMSSKNHYSLGPAELRFNGKATGVKGLPIIFDSGSTYTYFISPAYEALLSVLKKTSNRNKLKDANDDKTLPVCWKGTKAFNSIRDVRNLFKPLILSFTNSENVQFQPSPEAYLIVSDRGNVCLGILNGADVGLEDALIIGDISMQDKLVIYDNEEQQIGWIPANCDRLHMILDFGYIEGRMDLFESAKTIRLRTVEDKFLVANDDEETVFQHRNDSSRSSVWNVETITGGKYVRFKSCYGTYLTASDNLFPGMIGKKVVQSVPKSVDMSMTDWEPVRDGFQVRLRTRTGSFLRPNGGVPPWRNTVTHGMPQTSKTHEKVLWSIDVVEALPAPRRRSRSSDNKSASGCSDDRMSAPKASQRLTTILEDL